MEKIKKSVEENIGIIKNKTGHSVDIIYKYMSFNGEKIALIYAESMADRKIINDFILEYINYPKNDIKKSNIIDFLQENIPVNKIVDIKTIDDLLYNLFSGFVIMLVNNSSKALSFEARVALESSISIAENEIVVKGPKDAFTENYNINIGMIRRRIKSENLWLTEVKVGREGKTKVGIMHMNNIADIALVNDIVEKIKKIDIDVALGGNYIVELIEPKEKNPLVNYFSTERPDEVEMHLMDGRIAIITENIPIVNIVPTFFADFFHTTEDYYQKTINTNITRFVRLIAFIVTLFTPSIYIAVATYNQEAIPSTLLISMATQRVGVPFPSTIELILLMGTFEILKEADIRMPNAIGSSLAIVGSLVLGQAAVQAGVLSPIVVIVVAITTISGLIVANLDIMNGIRFWRLTLLLFASIFGALGVFMGLIVLTINITSIKSFGKPYMFPIAPFFAIDQHQGIFTTNTGRFKRRTSITAKKNLTKGGQI